MMASVTKNSSSRKHSRISMISATEALTPCTPYLMPFHVAYTGPAPVSTYLRVENAKSHVGCPEPFKTDSQMNASDTSNHNSACSSLETPSLLSEHKESDLASTSGTADKQKPTACDISSSSSDSTPDEQTRFSSAFRGRTIHGLNVDLPDGYTGVVFSTDDEASEPEKANEPAKRKGKAKVVVENQSRMTRGSARSRTARNEAMEAMDVEAEEEEDGEGTASQSTLDLMPSSQFKSFVLWHPDIPVDPGRDEYMSALGEWMKIASVLHQTPVVT
ncbi:ribonuclease H2, subunit C [Lentinula raphanica]|uniref:Ribonuclease H2, subunit C n=1 Tax=Lentinula raphanica TaxID=153919 RepID=A0AA38NYX2_9AGAR|nr:ribonuclease H2, subunit C [Lentinula raphanica]